MKLRIMVENHTYIDQYYLGEPGFSCYIETEGKRILFDFGYSDVLVENARRMTIDLSKVDTMVLSHGHNDHVGGLHALADAVDLSQKELIANPGCFLPKRVDEEDIGAGYTVDEVKAQCKLNLTTEPVSITSRLHYLGAIPRVTPFEGIYPIGETLVDGHWEPDHVADDSALVYQTEAGLFIITGCSHSGIINIVHQAQTVCNDQRILGIIGGFHLFKTDARTAATIDTLCDMGTTHLYPCHCVSFKVKAAIHSRIPIHEVGVGMGLSISEDGHITRI